MYAKLAIPGPGSTQKLGRKRQEVLHSFKPEIGGEVSKFSPKNGSEQASSCHLNVQKVYAVLV